MMGEYAVEVDNVSKHFRLYTERYTSLKERVLHGMRAPFDEFWALRDISMEIMHGETVGLLGHNGSGKSTLLKCIAGILQPTKGRIVLRGQVAALLELGAGFHAELSGRDNIYLNASLLGLSRKDVDKRFDEIVAFAELEEFIDNQIKFYSSGMQARLGFAVAVNVEPDILLVDEVLAVGDESFQRKCMDRIKRFQKEGRTIFFVSHSPELVRQICDKAYVLHHGRQVAQGTPGEAIRSFREHVMGQAGTAEEEPASGPGADEEGDGTQGTGDARIVSVAVEHPNQSTRPFLYPDEPLTIRVKFDATRPVPDAAFGIAVFSGTSLVFSSNSRALGVDVGTLDGPGEACFEFARMPLLEGQYDVSLEIKGMDSGTVHSWRELREHFEVMNPDGRAVGMVSVPMTITVQS